MRVKWKLQQELPYRPQTPGLESLHEIDAGHHEALEGCALIKSSAQPGGSGNEVLLYTPQSGVQFTLCMKHRLTVETTWITCRTFNYTD